MTKLEKLLIESNGDIEKVINQLNSELSNEEISLEVLKSEDFYKKLSQNKNFDIIMEQAKQTIIETYHCNKFISNKLNADNDFLELFVLYIFKTLIDTNTLLYEEICEIETTLDLLSDNTFNSKLGELEICKGEKPIILSKEDRKKGLLVLGPLGSGVYSQIISPAIYQDLRNDKSKIIFISRHRDNCEMLYGMGEVLNKKTLFVSSKETYEKVLFEELEQYDLIILHYPNSLSKDDTLYVDVLEKVYSYVLNYPNKEEMYLYLTDVLSTYHVLLEDILRSEVATLVYIENLSLLSIISEDIKTLFIDNMKNIIFFSGISHDCFKYFKEELTTPISDIMFMEFNTIYYLFKDKKQGLGQISYINQDLNNEIQVFLQRNKYDK